MTPNKIPTARIPGKLNPKQQKKKKVILVALACAGLVLSATVATLVFVSFHQPKPDPKNADMKDISKYIASEAYMSLNSQQKGQYADAVVGRYINLPPTEQKAARNIVGGMDLDRRAKERVGSSFWTSLIVLHSERFANLSPEEQAQQLPKMSSYLDFIKGKTQIDNLLKATSADASQRKLAQNYPYEGVRFLNNTTALQRAHMTRLAGKLVDYKRKQAGVQR